MYRGVIESKLLVATATLVSVVALWSEDVNASDPPSTRHSAEWVQIVSETGRGLHTYVVYPKESEATRAVVVLHENRGLTGWELELADRLAAAGFVVVAPDMLSERGPNHGNSDAFESAAAARDAIHALSPEEILVDLDAVAEYAQNLPARIDAVVVAGFCWGGAQAFRYAAHNPQLAAVIDFYGAAPNEEQIAQLRVPGVRVLCRKGRAHLRRRSQAEEPPQIARQGL